MQSKILEDLKRDKLVENKYRIGDSDGSSVGAIFLATFVLVPVFAFMFLALVSFLEDAIPMIGAVLFGKEFLVIGMVMVIATVIVSVALGVLDKRYGRHTKLGLEMSRYMDGMKLYIKMAEAERLKMLQSVEGADTSAEGIVRLYEKLLPYAAIFGLEESWMNEMKKYCEVKEIEEPDYLLTGLTISELSRATRLANDYASTATMMSSSGGGSSSGFSGGGGGGFSGGGGGGGGFSGR